MKLDTELTARIYKAWEDGQHNRRHLGASQIGRPCDREIWYGFRWFQTPSFDGRMMRLFDRGKREEAVVWGDLMACGIELDCELTQDGKQDGFTDLGGHFAGSVDAIGKLDGKRFLIEVKTSSDKPWQDLHKKGVEESKPEHYCQMQVYMGELKLKRALYISVNKNDDHLHLEWIDFDRDAFLALRQRAREIIFSKVAPDRLSDNPAYYQCKWCDKWGVCHGGETPEKNCRTCEHAEAIEDGSWYCGRNNGTILDVMNVGCDDWCEIGNLPF